MAFLESDAKNISSGWPAPQSLSAPNIGDTLGAILRNRIAQQQQTQEAISAAIKSQQSRSQDAAFAQALQNAGLTQGQDISGLSGAQATRLAQLIQEQTPDTDVDALHQAMTRYYNAGADAGGRGGRSSGVPRYDYNGVLLPGSEYLKRKDQDRAAQTVGQLSAQEADAQARATQYEKKYGVDTDAGGLKAPGWGADQATKDQFARDQADYFKAYQDMTKAKTTRQNYEKWYRGTLQPGGTTPGGMPDDEEDGSMSPPAPPQSGASPPPSVSPNDVRQTQQAPGVTPSPIPYDQTIPTSTPRPNRPPASDTAAGHTSTYGTPAPGAGSGQIGDLVVGQSKRPVGGKMYTWWGDPASGGKGWLPD